jgi:hypothetical protein
MRLKRIRAEPTEGNQENEEFGKESLFAMLPMELTLSEAYCKGPSN